MKRRKVSFRGINFNNYEIGEEGNVYNIKSGRKLKPFPDGRRGYLKVKLYYGGVNKKMTIAIHRAMMEIFKPLDDYTGMEVDHINKNITDNRLSNLRWLSAEDNAKRKKDYFHYRYDIRNWYIYALNLYFIYDCSVNKISEIFNLDPQTLSDLIKGRRHKDLMRKWKMYLNRKEKAFKVKGSTTRVLPSRIDLPEKAKYVQVDFSKPLENTYPFLKNPRGKLKK